VIVDGTTDSAALEAEMVYVRSAIQGRICCNFAGYVNIERANANGILGAIKTTMERLHVSAWSNKLVGMGIDGAAVMLGKDNGVIAKFMYVSWPAHPNKLVYRLDYKSWLQCKLIIN
jgi:hypothetical protein